VKLLLGTAKGLVVYSKNTSDWQVETVHFTGFPVSMLYVDARTQTWWAGTPHRHWGQKLHRSTDAGKTWQQVAAPRYPSVALLKNGKQASLKLIWCMAQAGADKPNELWLGTEPGGLFHSKDNGDTWILVESLWEHKAKSDLWFGAGKDDPFIHSIVVDPKDSNHVYIAVSCAGVYETNDGGKTWFPRNIGLKATYLPNPDAEVGHDPHLLLACETGPSVIQNVGEVSNLPDVREVREMTLWQQNHCGIFRSTNGGMKWDDVSDKNGIAHYGFALAIDLKNANRAWVIPAQSDELRVPHDLALCVCRTEDGGQTWQPLRDGLPQNHSFDIVFRHSFDNFGDILAFGTTTGNLYLSENGGEVWQCLSHNLARIDAVRFVL
jgi:photosystem II stability/assembly factor-like uncharacterized protein